MCGYRKKTRRMGDESFSIYSARFFSGVRYIRQFSKKLLNSILIFMSYSLVMSVIWICLESPDLAITEAAVGAGITSVLFFVTLKKINAIEEENKKDEKESMIERRRR